MPCLQSAVTESILNSAIQPRVVAAVFCSRQPALFRLQAECCISMQLQIVCKNDVHLAACIGPFHLVTTHPADDRSLVQSSNCVLGVKYINRIVSPAGG